MKTKAYHFVGHVAAALLLLCTASALAQRTAESDTSSCTYLVILEEGKIRKRGEDAALLRNTYVLKLDKDDIYSIMSWCKEDKWFKEHISGDELARTWKEGAIDFGEAPLKTMVLHTDFNVQSIKKTADKVEFVFNLDGNASLNLDRFGKLKEGTALIHQDPEGGNIEWLWDNK